MAPPGRCSPAPDTQRGVTNVMRKPWRSRLPRSHRLAIPRIALPNPLRALIRVSTLGCPITQPTTVKLPSPVRGLGPSARARSRAARRIFEQALEVIERVRSFFVPRELDELSTIVVRPLVRSSGA